MLDCPLYCCVILYNKSLVVSVLSGLVVLHLSTASRTAPVRLIYCTTHLVHVQSLALIRHREREYAQDTFSGQCNREDYQAAGLIVNGDLDCAQAQG